MRARNIKPGFFKCTDLSEVDFASRLLFIGLWCFADRDGRFEWNAKKIKAEIFPYDNVNIDKLLCNLMSLHFITRNDTTGYVEKFAKHQNPHPHEAKSALPPKPEQNQCHDMSLTSREMSLTCRADSLIPDSLIPDSLIPDTCGASPRIVDEILSFFEALWNVYPKKDGKKAAQRHYLATVKTEEDMDRIDRALGAYIDHVKDTDPKYIKNGSTWFNNWQDWEPQDGQ